VTGRRAPAPGFDLVCVSHLWWDWVWQRPQQLLSRIAALGAHVTYVEEPRIEVGPEGTGFDLVEEGPNLRVARLWTRTDQDGFHRQLVASREGLGGNPWETGEQLDIASLMFHSHLQPWLEREVRALFASPRDRPLVLWLYTPVVVGFIDLLRPDMVVHDVMDDLTAFRFAPPKLRRQRDELLARADLVFAGGPSLHRGTATQRPDAHLFPSGVDAAHFARARRPGPTPDRVAGIPTPVVGYVGVIDERLDLDLLAGLADARPDWSFVMAGPILKVEKSRLPRRPNLHYVGSVPYAELPDLVRTFDVAMMPFALNEATRSISPTKTLEYLAAGRPVVSTPIADVVSLYGSVVSIAGDAGAFVGAAESALDAAPEVRVAQLRDADAVVERSSWDATAERMFRLIEERLG
jgi:UDP-galactopyranose mutase